MSDNPLIIVSDHAVLRLLERRFGVNVEFWRDHIAHLCGPAAAVGAVSLKLGGLKYVIAGRTVTTVLPDHPMPTRTGIERLGRGGPA
jgi:hypothetical protein